MSIVTKSSGEEDYSTLQGLLNNAKDRAAKEQSVKEERRDSSGKYSAKNSEKSAGNEITYSRKSPSQQGTNNSGRFWWDNNDHDERRSSSSPQVEGNMLFTDPEDDHSSTSNAGSSLLPLKLGGDLDNMSIS